MKNNIKAFAVLFALISVFSFACTKEEEDNTTTPTTNNPDHGIAIPSNLIKIGETYMNGAGAKAVVYAEQNLIVGYNKLYFALYDSSTGNRLKDGHFELGTEMDMGTMSHSSPVENMDIEAPSDQLWKANAVFSMPSTAGTWYLHMHFHNHANNKEGEGELVVTVIQPTMGRLINFLDSTRNNAPVLISLVQPASPKVGTNDYEVTIHNKIGMDSFPFADDYTVTINPQMISMGHGSPNNVNPVHTQNGHYNGKAVFTMSGLWRIYMNVSRNGAVLKDSVYFDIEF